MIIQAIIDFKIEDNLVKKADYKNYGYASSNATEERNIARTQILHELITSLNCMEEFDNVEDIWKKTSIINYRILVKTKAEIVFEM